MPWLETQRHMLQCAEIFCRDTKRSGKPMIQDPGVMTRLTKVAADNLVTEVLGYRSLWTAAERNRISVAARW